MQLANFCFFFSCTPTKDYIIARSLQYFRRCTNFITKYMYRRDPYYYMDPVCSKIQYRQGPPYYVLVPFFSARERSPFLKLVLDLCNWKESGKIQEINN